MIKEIITKCGDCGCKYKGTYNDYSIYLCDVCLGIAEDRLEWFKNIYIHKLID